MTQKAPRGYDLAAHHRRDIHVERQSYRAPVIGRVSDPDDRERHRSNEECLANDVGVRAHPRAPETVAYDCHWMRARSAVVVGCEQPAHRRAHAEHFEIIPGHDLAPRPLRFFPIAYAEGRRRRGRQAFKNLVAVAQILVVKIRKRPWVAAYGALHYDN